jgi:hypothetical protein
MPVGQDGSFQQASIQDQQPDRGRDQFTSRTGADQMPIANLMVPLCEAVFLSAPAVVQRNDFRGRPSLLVHGGYEQFILVAALHDTTSMCGFAFADLEAGNHDSHLCLAADCAIRPGLFGENDETQLGGCATRTGLRIRHRLPACPLQQRLNVLPVQQGIVLPAGDDL